MTELVYLEPRDVFDPMIIGIASRPRVLVYDLDAMISYWSEQFPDEGTDGAWEWYEYNVLGSYQGEYTPIYVSKSDYLISQEDLI